MKKLNPITAKYLVAFLCIFIFTFIGQIVIQNYIENQKLNSTIVNIAGRQRMLSQKIAKLIYKGDQNSQEIKKEINELENSHQFLKLQLPNQLANFIVVEPLIKSIKEGALCNKSQCKKLIVESSASTNLFLENMDKIVFDLDKTFEAQVIQLSNIEYIVFLIISIIMLYEFFWVLIPFQKKLFLENKKMIQIAKLSSIGQMSAGIAHEINNPLAIIHGSATILQRNISEDSKTFMNDIIGACDRIKKISESLRRFSRDEVSEAEMEKISVHQLIEEAIYFNSFSKSEFLKIKFITPSLENLERFDALGDSTLILQALVNLIGNSIDAISDLEKPWIRITTKKASGKIEIVVTDSGSGISEKNLKNLFNPFFTTKSASNGTGLGLSLSRDIVRKYGGDIKYDKDHGHTAFKIILLSV